MGGAGGRKTGRIALRHGISGHRHGAMRAACGKMDTHLGARALVVRRAERSRAATLGAEMTVWEATMACMVIVGVVTCVV